MPTSWSGMPSCSVGSPMCFPDSTSGTTPRSGGPLIGSGDWTFLWQGGFALQGAITPAVLGFFLYMAAFMDTTATIPTGSMAERWKWRSFVGWGLFCGAIYYPLFGAWTWGGGWLNKLWSSMGWGVGYADFAGSGIVHAVGGAAALAGALVLGPRIGKFRADGKANTLARPPHPDGGAGDLHPSLRMVRIQCRVDLCRDRRPIRDSCSEHCNRRCLWCGGLRCCTACTSGGRSPIPG